MLTRLRQILRDRLAGDERGFAMVAVIAALTVSSLLVVGAVAAANGDLPIARESQDRKAAYGAAEAGLNYYLFHLNEDPDYWTKCNQVADPNPADLTDNSPVNLAGANPRTWRTIPDTKSSYTIELLPAPEQAKCIPGNQGTMLDPTTGTFRIRATGKSGDVTRSIVATFRRKGFLDFLYLTNYETLDPDADSSATTTVPMCAKPRSLRSSLCTRIVFQEGDQLKGPLHTNDESILTCGVPIFGRTDANDKVEVTGSVAPGWINSGSGCASGTPTFRTADAKLGLGADTVDFPISNNSLETVAAPPKGARYTGKTIITLNGSANTMNVWNANQSPQQQNNVPLPANGVIYVKAGSGCVLNSYPTAANYDEGNQCAVAYVSGSYDKSLTIGSAGDIIVKPTIGVDDTGLVRVANSAAVLGLIATRYVRVYHKTSDAVQDVKIDAAILSLQHSFIVDNFSSGAHIGDLRITGAIAQNFRGPVGQGTAGFTKDYNYDDRLNYRSPPYFLPPLNAAWSVTRKNEQVPAAAGP